MKVIKVIKAKKSIKTSWIFLLICTIFVLTGCGKKEPDYSKVELKKVRKDVFVHVSYGKFGENMYPANGLVYFAGNRAIIIDTPWTDKQTEELCYIISKKYKKKIEMVIFTHFHRDNLGGIEYLKKKGIKGISTALTKKLAYQRDGIVIEHPDIDKKIWNFSLGGKTIEIYYPGPAHAQDNIVVWFEDKKILYAGCMVKSLSSKNKGNTADADLKSWPDSVLNLINRYPKVSIVIPGHGQWGTKDLLHHTLKVIKQ